MLGSVDGMFRIEVDGEVFEVRPGEHGGTHYDWLSGPNPGYGFSSSAPISADHERHILVFLSMVDPETGYIEDEGPIPDPRLSAAVVRYVWGDGTQSWPSRHPEALERGQRRFLPRIESLLAEIFAVDPPFSAAGSLKEIGDAVATFLATEHRDLDGDARDALANCYGYSFK